MSVNPANNSASIHSLDIINVKGEQEVLRYGFQFRCLTQGLKIDLGNAADNEILGMLIGRERGTFLKVVEKSEGGTLFKTVQKVEGFWQKLKYRFNRDHHEKELARVINGVIVKLNAALQKKLGEKPEWKREDWKAWRIAMRHLFSKEVGLGRLNTRLCDRSLFEGSTLDLLTMEENTAKLQIGSKYFISFNGEKNKLLEPRILPIDFGNDKLNINCWKLLRGECSSVDDKGYFTIPSGLKERIRFWSHKSERVAKAKSAVEEIFEELNGRMEPEKSRDVILSDEYLQIAFRQFFQNGGVVAKLPHHIFERGKCIYEKSRLERILDPDLHEKRKAFRKAYKKYTQDHSHRSQMENAFKQFVLAEFQFGRSIGMPLNTISSGNTGAVRKGTDRHGNWILVVKGEQEGPHGKDHPSICQQMKRAFFTGERACLKDNSEACAEVDAETFDRAYDIHVVSPTMREPVVSDEFSGALRKECSLQMYVDGTKPLKEYLGLSRFITLFMNHLPRSFLRWYCTRHKEELLKKMPQELIMRLSILNFLIEDLDGHFDNVLVKQWPEESEKVADFALDFFKNKENQKVLQELLHSVKVKDKRIMVVKIDSGSSQPHQHPDWSWWRPLERYRATRNQYLIPDVLPHLDGISINSWNQIEGHEELFRKACMEKMRIALKSIIKPEEIFEQYWKENIMAFGTWFEDDLNETEADHRTALVDALIEKSRKHLTAETRDEGYIEQLKQLYLTHFRRIKLGLLMREESYAVMRKSKGELKNLFKIHTASDFERFFDEEEEASVSTGA